MRLLEDTIDVVETARANVRIGQRVSTLGNQKSERKEGRKLRDNLWIMQCSDTSNKMIPCHANTNTGKTDAMRPIGSAQSDR
ncbi:hypothetical protein M8818_004785 [Zalaria obscura]|uniref:Uncharacterized protein n=1 Tax=Zalaria obscura TaxID=2024903 RepID=A0ACC3SAL3_9PEZI